MTRRALVVVAAVALVAVTGAGVGESAACRMIRDRVVHAAPRLGSGMTVSEGGGPVLWDLVNGDIPQLVIGSEDADIGALSEVSVHAQLDDVRFAGRRTVGAVHVEVTVPLQSLASAVQAAAPSMAVSSVTTDPGAGTITLAVGPGGLGQLTLHPAITDGRISVTVADLTVFGRFLPIGRPGSSGPERGRRWDRRAPTPSGSGPPPCRSRRAAACSSP